MGWANWPDYFSKVSKCPHHHREVFHVIDWKGLYTSIAFDCPIITKLTVGRLLKCKYTRELTKIYNIMYNIYGIHLAFISFIYVTGMGSIAFSVEQIGDVLEKNRRHMQKYKTDEYLFHYQGYIMIVSCVIWLKRIYMFVFGNQYKISGN